MKDFAKPIRQRLISETPADTSLDAKRRAALAYLGDRHILHPDYRFCERHAFDASRSAPHSLLRPVHLAAQAAGRI